MKFETENDRLKHPQAKLLPSIVWKSYFSGSISTSELAVMQVSSNELFATVESLKETNHFCNFKIALCCAYREPPINNTDLINILKILNLPFSHILMLAASTGRQETLDFIDPTSIKTDVTNIFFVFEDLAKDGHLNVINRLIALAETLDPPISVQDMIKHREFAAFRKAVDNGHLDIINRLIELVTPICVLEMIKANNFHAFTISAEEGYLGVINRLIELASTIQPSIVADMIKADDFEAIKMAATFDKLDVMNRLTEIASKLEPPILEDMIKVDDFYPFMIAVSSGYVELVNKFLNLPSVFAHAEAHEQEHSGKHVKPFIESFIERKLSILKLRNEESHPSVVVTQQEAQICFYIVRNLIRQPLTPKTLANIEFLISIPAVKSLLHRPISEPDLHNELLREALRLGNRRVADLLMSIPEVLAQAERDDFYATEARGSIDLRAVAQNRESSILALSPQEQTMLSRLEKKYRPHIARIGLEKAFTNVYQAIITRYNNNPAVLKLKNGKTVNLPLSYQDFVQTADKFSVTEKKNALKAYYQHPTHTVFRYLSKPNPWMATNSSYVEVNQGAHERWSTFEGYKDMITLLWLAATDESEPATDGFTVATRVDELIYAIALIGRAHNWDKTRVKTDTNGQAILDNKGNSIREQYDDLKGDKPSCYSGVKRRLFYALKGSPLFKDIQKIISFTFHEKLRAHMMEQFNGTDTAILEAVLINYAKLIQGENTEALTVITGEWNVPEATIMQWKSDLQKRYGAIFGRDEVGGCIEREFQNFFSQSSNLSQFLALAERCQLTELCEQELKVRSDTLANNIKNAPNLIDFLNQTDEITGETRILNAIHLGLLGEIGERLGVDEFTQLLSPDEATRQAYARVLAAYADNPNIDNWLVKLHEPLKSLFIDEIREMASEAVEFSPIEKFEMFLNGLDKNDSEGRELYRQLTSKKSRGTIEEVSRWLSTYPEHNLASKIRDKALELNLKLNLRITTATSATTQRTSLSSSSESDQSHKDLSDVTFEDLPNDPAGELLKQIEDEEQRVREVKRTSGRYSFYKSNNEGIVNRNEPPRP